MTGRWQDLVQLALTVLWLVALGGVAAAAFARFRTTAAGLLIGGSCAALAAKSALVAVLQRLLASRLAWDHPALVTTFVASSLLSTVLLLVLAAGILLIPSSLRRLAR